MDGITITITGATGAQIRELMAELLGIAAVAQFKQEADAPEASDESGVYWPDYCPNTTPTRAAEIAPVKRTRATKLKAEAPVAAIVPDTAAVASDVPDTAKLPAATKEDFLAKLNGLRATFGEGIIPELRVILGKYTTEAGGPVTQSSQLQAQDFPAIMADFAKLESKHNNI